MKSNEEIKALATQVIEKHSGKPDVKLQVAVLLASVGDTLSNDAIFDELTAIEQSGIAWRQTFADSN